MKPSEVSEALELKLFSCLTLSQLVVPGMRVRKWGRIVNIAGFAGANPDANNLPTSFANVAMMNLTRGLSDEVAAMASWSTPLSLSHKHTAHSRTL
jgi:short-subunit dehydrogenase